MLPHADRVTRGSIHRLAVAALVLLPGFAAAQAQVGRGDGLIAGAAAAPRWTVAPAAEHSAAVETASGFGLFATVRNRSVDAAAPDRLVEGPTGSLFDQAAGLGWRRDNVSAMVGYMHPGGGRPADLDDSIAYRRPRGRFGVGLSLHY